MCSGKKAAVRRIFRVTRLGKMIVSKPSHRTVTTIKVPIIAAKALILASL